MNDNFICKCGHRNKMHVDEEDLHRICIEYVSWPFQTEDEQICNCSDFEPDNLKTLEIEALKK